MIASMQPVLSVSHVVVSARLDRPVGNAHAQWRSRRSVLVTLEDEGGRKGRGEAAPLPGLSRETIDDVLAALATLGSSFEPTEIDVRALPPSLRFAIESALLDLRSADRPAFVALLGDEAYVARVPEQLELQVLLDDLESAEARARDAHGRGARTFKVKIGREGRASDEASLLEAVRALGRDVVIRADANGTLAAVDVIAPALARARVEYVEDPGPIDGPHWVGVPMALDASVAADPHDAIARARSLGAPFLVLKPTLLGGLEDTLAIAARARARGLKVVLSHTLEGPVGLAAIAHLALAASASSHRALWGAQGLAPWTGCERFVVEGGDEEPLALPYYLGACRVLRPSSAGLGLV
ncbi:MAG: o-succinylbenzoate synthase [Deltaproteobacteria bacterium]|nr:o-succinylbenzoate synthase [Deltaproteobacteria bacterium]